jgi:hypothetical protein
VEFVHQVLAEEFKLKVEGSYSTTHKNLPYCFLFLEYFKNGYTLYLNSGLSSSRNHYGQRVITREADLVTAHEFGHNWGSEHDPDNPECSPSASQGGSYLMYTYSVSGYDLNNKVALTSCLIM